ncbi:MAG UNVERIFIED_CONTAM: DUF2674 domain-containing protein [Rickettsiaceae bacterium]|jgi:ribosomal protein S25
MSNIKAVTKKPAQKLVSFTESEFKTITKEIDSGWKIISLVANGSRYVGIMEEVNKNPEDAIYIPPRRKLKIIA